MKKRFLAVFLSLAILSTLMFQVVANAYNHPNGMHYTAQIAAAPTSGTAYDQVIASANTALTHSSDAIANLYVPNYYDDQNTHNTNAARLEGDGYDAYVCAVAYTLSGNTQYADKSKYFIMAWANVNTSYSGYDGPLVTNRAGNALIRAAELLSNYSGFTSADKTKFKTWVTNVAVKAAEYEIYNTSNNHQDWGLLNGVLAAHYLDNSTKMASYVTELKGAIDHQISSDGSMPEEMARGEKALWYCYYGLGSMTAAIEVVKNATGENLYTYNSSKVKKALDWYFPKCTNPPSGYSMLPSKDSWPSNLYDAMAEVYGVSAWRTWVNSGSRPLVKQAGINWTFQRTLKPGISAGSTPTPTPTPAQRINETFTSTSNMTKVTGGTWAVTSGRYKLTAPADVMPLGNIAVHNTTITGDFTLTTLGRVTGTTSAWNDFEVIFGYQDANNYYFTSFNESNDGNTSGIFKVVNGTATQLTDITSLIVANTDYNIEIVRSGSTITVKRGGTTVATATDSTYTSGKVGYGSRNDSCEFDNLLVP
ncbi:MAG: alginate lyase family protein [Clostridiaceae bacterium]|nr:alginate lyase family protein [Clostridiaceae bacterium]